MPMSNRNCKLQSGLVFKCTEKLCWELATTAELPCTMETFRFKSQTADLFFKFWK